MSSSIEVLSDSVLPIMSPMHPLTKNPLHESISSERMPGKFRLIKPLGYLDMLLLMAHAMKILADSGVFRRSSTCWGCLAIG